MKIEFQENFEPAFPTFPQLLETKGTIHISGFGSGLGGVNADSKNESYFPVVKPKVHLARGAVSLQIMWRAFFCAIGIMLLILGSSVW